MIKTAPLIDTLGKIKYRNFLAQPFTIDLLFPMLDNNTVPIFDCWRGKNMMNWYRFVDENKTIVLEFYPDYYNIKYNNNNQQQILPKNINDFINDMNKINFQLYWNDDILNLLDPMDILNVSEIEDYYRTLLLKIDKSHELL